MKIGRQSKIVELISKHNIETQEELADLLVKAGYRVTQATISRDIRELKLTKVATDNGKQKYIVLTNQESGMSEKYIRILRDGFVSMDMAQNIIIVKTVSGMAMAVAAALDALHIEGIVGCIAGDDTIMCAIRTVPDTISVMEKLSKLINGNK
ncbi:arginine repressor [Lachnoclostridium phytofermentans]|uniref:Arginine repressor n=1 Tax=Lachnoclostridium phytofermentans (strain ATCC 700394 / DSM 18823 / ISDg) TaxID=357809 RepID=ARGR_LACP7|nr:arginine repressor [Lachnoclostridium phytofermentans]A9KMB5.1 RecName: Full=Arginine repressor [Lachnoclostridium phytofermentans ISDg]ABX42869.1 arginine repressor, ArgR [Lachnoclostridium phytofermentans ISDg]